MCISKITIKNNDPNIHYSHIQVPCGKCHICKNRRIDDWVFRITKESERYSDRYFLTLTYAEPPVTSDGEPTLVKPHVQKWIKRLRKNSPDGELKYYVAGEYGGELCRPHYHAILLSNGITDTDIIDSWQDRQESHNSRTGHVFFGSVEPSSIAYTVGYTKTTKELDNPDIQSEFGLMSKGMGMSYLTPQMVKYHQSTQHLFITKKGGQKQALPRYLKDKLFTQKDIRKSTKSFREFLEKREFTHQHAHDEHEAIKASINNYHRKHKHKMKA